MKYQAGKQNPNLDHSRATHQASPRKFHRTVLATAAVLLYSLAVEATPPPAGIAPVMVPAGGFAIAGGVVAGAQGVNAGCWMSGPGGVGVLDANGAPLNPSTTFHFVDPYNSSSDYTFTSGKWTDDPNTWGWTAGKPPAKGDLNNVLVHLTTSADNHLWLVIGGDRLSTAGDGYIDFELLQNSLVRNSNGGFTSAGPNGGRTANDLLLSLYFSNGGSQADFFAWRWQTNAAAGGFSYVDATAALPTGKVFVAANSNVVAVPFGAFGQTNYIVNSFAEAAVDLTALMGNFDPCLSIGVKTIMVKTKVSSSGSSTLADFIEPIQYSLRLGPGANAGADQVQCSQGNSTAFALQGTATQGDFPIASTTWSVLSGTATIDSPASLNTTAHVSSSSATLRLTVMQANGCGTSDDVVLTVSPLPACSITGSANVCPKSSSQFVAPAGMNGYAWSISGNGSITGPADQQSVTVTAGATCGTNFTLTLTTLSNNCSSICSTDVMVSDTTPPTITAPPSVTLECPADTAPASTGTAVAQDDCSIPTVVFSDSVATPCAGTQIITRTWTATDGCGNAASAVQTITVQDTKPPVVTAPANVTIACSDSLNPASNTALGVATAIDGCSAASTPTYTDQIVAGNCPGNYTVRRTWSSRDGCGNVGTALQIITVQDTTPPTVTAPANLVLPFTADITTNNTGVATAQDTCSDVGVSYLDNVAIESDGSQLITRTWTATDSCGNSASAVQTITLDAPGALVLPNQTNVFLTDLTTLTVTNTATNPNSSTNPLVYQLVNPPAGATIDTNGIITWTPTLDQSPSTNVFITVVTGTVTSAAGTSTISATNSFVVIVSGPYDGINLNDPTQSLADNDGDGLSNLLEYSVGSDPNNSADGNTGIIVWITEDGGSHYLAMKFKERINAASLGLQYFPEVSADKQTWLADSANVLQLSVDPSDSLFNWVSIRDVTPITAAQARFIHLRVVYNTNIQTASPTWIGTDTVIQGNSGSGSKLTLFSQRMVLPIVYAGTVSSLQNTALTDTNATWTTGQFASVAAPAYAEFDNGYMVDISGSTSTTKSLSLAGSLSGVAAPGDAYRVRQHFTVASLFGTNNETGLKTGESAAQADNILLTMAQNQSTMSIFYFSNQYYHGWVRGDLTPADDQVVYPEEGLMVSRVAPEDRDVFLCGPIKTGVTVAPVAPGFNLVGTLKSLSTMTLSTLNLYTGDPTTGLASGVSAAGSDNLMVVQPDGSTATYFYYDQPGVFSGWVDGGFNPSGNVQVPAGSAFFIKRLNTNPAFNWTIPAE